MSCCPKDRFSLVYNKFQFACLDMKLHHAHRVTLVPTRMMPAQVAVLHVEVPHSLHYNKGQQTHPPVVVHFYSLTPVFFQELALIFS